MAKKAEKHINDLITDMIDEMNAAKKDGRIDFKEVMTIASSMVELALHTKDAWTDDEHFETFLAEAQASYDKFIRPIDITGVPNLFEGKVDDLISMLIINGLRAAYAKVSGD